MSFTFNSSIPAAGNFPGNDQPLMLLNNISTAGLIAIDHIGFNTANGGAHTHVQLKEVAGAVPPAGLIGATFETLYSQQVAAEGNLFFTRGASGTGIQLTGPGTPSALANGYTFLAGGLLIQWGINTAVSGGSFASGSANGVVTFSAANIAFPKNCFVVLPTPFYNGAGIPSGAASVNITQTGPGALSATQFTWKFNSNSNKYTGFNWIAIGN